MKKCFNEPPFALSGVEHRVYWTLWRSRQQLSLQNFRRNTNHRPGLRDIRGIYHCLRSVSDRQGFPWHVRITQRTFLRRDSLTLIEFVFSSIPWKVTAILNLVGTLLFTACAVIILKDWSDTKERNYWPPNTTRMDLTCATGAISIIGAVTFLIDCLFIIRLGARGEIQ